MNTTNGSSNYFLLKTNGGSILVCSNEISFARPFRSTGLFLYPLTTENYFNFSHLVIIETRTRASCVTQRLHKLSLYFRRYTIIARSEILLAIIKSDCCKNGQK